MDSQVQGENIPSVRGTKRSHQGTSHLNVMFKQIKMGAKVHDEQNIKLYIKTGPLLLPLPSVCSFSVALARTDHVPGPAGPSPQQPAGCLCPFLPLSHAQEQAAHAVWGRPQPCPFPG